MVFTTAQKDAKHLGYFCNKICYQEIQKIAQSGHTDALKGEKAFWAHEFGVKLNASSLCWFIYKYFVHIDVHRWHDVINRLVML